MRVLISITLLLIGNLVSAQSMSEQPEWRITVKVMDENGRPIMGANVGIGSYSNSIPIGIKGLSDNDGIFALSAHAAGIVSCGAEKAGYYQSTGVKKEFRDQVNGEWQPWNPVLELKLRPIGNPIAMYARQVETKLQKEDEPLGFDLMVGDWAAPYGRGRISDMLFTLHREVSGDKEYSAELKLTFPNKEDGIAVAPPESWAGSAFTTSRTAIETGYEPFRSWNYNSATRPVPSFGFFFRVRTILDENGRIKSALYGKIRGDLRFYVGTKAPHAGMGFDYYLNPTPNDRNLEFDPTKNLFSNLPFDQQIREP